MNGSRIPTQIQVRSRHHRPGKQTKRWKPISARHLPILLADCRLAAEARRVALNLLPPQPQQLVNNPLQLLQVAALRSDLAEGAVAVHLRVAAAPHPAGLRVQPQHPLRPGADALQHLQLRVAAVVAGVAQDDDGGVAVDVVQRQGRKVQQALAVVGGAAVLEVDQLYGLLQRVLVKQVAHLAKVARKGKAANPRQHVVQAVQKHQQKLGVGRHGPAHVAHGQYLRLVLLDGLPVDVKHHAVVGHPAAHGLGHVELAAPGPAPPPGMARRQLLRHLAYQFVDPVQVAALDVAEPGLRQHLVHELLVAALGVQQVLALDVVAHQFP